MTPHEIAQFWTRLEPAWNRRPALIARPFERPLVDEREFLGFLRRWSQDARDGTRGIAVDKIDADALLQADETLDAFERRMATIWRRDWYLYLSDGIQQYDGAVWERAVAVIKPALALQGGLPSGGMMLDLFYGKYASTPTGIHLDSSDNLAFVVRGPKRLMFWPPERFDAKVASPPVNPSHQQALTGRYSDHVDDAIVIDAVAGDVIYWPKEYWHISTSGSAWSGMVTLPMWWTASPAQLARAMLLRLLELTGQSELYRVNLNDLAPDASRLPPTLAATVSQMKTQINARLDATARIAWAKFVTAYGFSTPPSPRPAPDVTASTRVRVNYPVVVIDLGRAVAVIGCGQQMLLPCHELSAVVEALHVGADPTVSDLARLIPADAGTAHERLPEMVRQLVAFRALDVVS